MKKKSESVESTKGQVEASEEKMGSSESKIENLGEFKKRREEQFPDQKEPAEVDITHSSDEVEEVSPIINRVRPATPVGKFFCGIFLTWRKSAIYPQVRRKLIGN